MPLLKIYKELNFGGTPLEVIGSKPNLKEVDDSSIGPIVISNWNDEIQSFEVISGWWKMFRDVGFDPNTNMATQKFGPGTRIANCQDAGFPNKWVSAIQYIGENKDDAP